MSWIKTNGYAVHRALALGKALKGFEDQFIYIVTTEEENARFAHTQLLTTAAKEIQKLTEEFLIALKSGG